MKELMLIIVGSALVNNVVLSQFLGLCPFLGVSKKTETAVGLDVYEEESELVYEDMSERILQSSTIQRLLSFPNVAMTSHQGFFTEEALTNIAETTLQNAADFRDGKELKNQVTI